jgi:16S rRNA G966 N2-methylase RsmD
MKFLYPLFALTTFLSSFLLFQVQPLIGKHILPWYGGSSAVWVTAMFFFMVALAVGYIYALLLSKLTPWYQGVIHSLVILATSASMFVHSKLWPSAITPEFGDLQNYFTDPVLAVFGTLIITIGLPFALLSSTSSILQLWYAELSGREPFTLYSISNIGSLLGLLSYPLFFEPFFTTYAQGQTWSYGLFLYAVLLIIICYLFGSRVKGGVVKEETNKTPIPSRLQFLVWLGVASVPVMVLLAGTSFMTVSIAPVPFLWVGPLALYLASFIFTFRNGERPPVWFNEVAVVLAAIITLILVVFSLPHVLVTIAVTHFALFAIFHWCHEYLYATKPEAAHLTLFYVALSLGGILGSLIIKISTSFIFTMPIELAVILIISTGVICYKWFKAGDLYLPMLTQNKLKPLSALVLGIVILITAFNIYIKQSNVIAQERNFFGYKAIYDNIKGNYHIWSMQHGLTNHGYQVVENGLPIIRPVAYYSLTSGVGKAFAYLRSREATGAKVAIAGLGSGGLAAYCTSGDEFTFLEIDPEVVALAKKYFTYLEYCPQHQIIISDARLALEQQQSSTYDLLVIDAYADDMVPVHLMTTEAIALYKKLLKPEGILAIHISSRYLNLLPVTGAIAKDNKMAGRHWFDHKPLSDTATPSEWVLLAKDEQVFNNPIFAEMSTFGVGEDTLLWTDTYSALLPALRLK